MQPVLVFAIVLAADTLLQAQAPDQNLAFEVASVKPVEANAPRSNAIRRGGPGTSDPGRFSTPRATLADLVTQAYDVWPDQVQGPAWISDRRDAVYSVDATMPAGTTKEQFRVMFQNLLKERFHLVFHHETQSRPGYELVVAAGGPKIHPFVPPTEPPQAGLKADRNGFPQLGSTGNGVAFTFNTSGRPEPIRFRFRDTMTAFCRALGSDINASNGIPMGGAVPRVLDKTGLTGVYEFTLEFAGVMVLPGTVPQSNPNDLPTASDPTDGAPNIFTAVEKQLGLKLQKLKDVPVDVLIIDKADRVPTEN